MQTLRGIQDSGTRSHEVLRSAGARAVEIAVKVRHPDRVAEFASRRIEMAATGRFVTTSPQSVLLLHLDPTVALTGCR